MENQLIWKDEYNIGVDNIKSSLGSSTSFLP